MNTKRDMLFLSNFASTLLCNLHMSQAPFGLEKLKEALSEQERQRVAELEKFIDKSCEMSIAPGFSTEDRQQLAKKTIELTDIFARAALKIMPEKNLLTMMVRTSTKMDISAAFQEAGAPTLSGLVRKRYRSRYAAPRN